jgi:hypothetical protein
VEHVLPGQRLKIDIVRLPVDWMPYEDEPLLECASHHFVVGKISGRHEELNPVDQAPVQLLPANQVHRYIEGLSCRPMRSFVIPTTILCLQIRLTIT